VEIPFSLPFYVAELGNVKTPYTFGEVVDPSTFTGDPSTPVIIEELHVYWTGKIDALIQFTEGYFVMDHKTTSVAGPGFFKEFELSQQTIGYTWAARQIFSLPIRGLLLNALIGRAPSKTGVALTFERQRYIYRDDQLEEWKSDVQSLINDYLFCLQTGDFPRKTKSCVSKYGTCGYHEVCSAPPSMRSHILSSDIYEPYTWTPLHHA